MNCLLMYGAWLDYLISEIVVTGHLQQMIEPSFDRADFSAGACGRWLLYSLPGNVCALGLVSLVPRLETLVGVINATSVVLASFALPALAGLRWGRRGCTTDGDKEGLQRQGEDGSGGAGSSSPGTGTDTGGATGSAGTGGDADGVGVAVVASTTAVAGAMGDEARECMPETHFPTAADIYIQTWGS